MSGGKSRLLILAVLAAGAIALSAGAGGETATSRKPDPVVPKRNRKELLDALSGKLAVPADGGSMKVEDGSIANLNAALFVLDAERAGKPVFYKPGPDGYAIELLAADTPSPGSGDWIIFPSP